MRILIVALSGSIHTSRWIEQIDDQNWEIFLFPSYDNLWINNNLKNVTYCIPFFSLYKIFLKYGIVKYYSFFYKLAAKLFVKTNSKYYSNRLFKYIIKIKPDIIHSMETQGAGYLVYDVRNNFFKNQKFPKWWHANWGSDIFLFGRLKKHEQRIKDVLSTCDYYSCECKRDVRLALDNGFKNAVLPVYPNSGGLKTNLIDKYKNNQPTSARKFIMLKGYQGWAGRALVGIRAIARCSDILKGFTLVIYTNTSSDDIKIASELLMNDYNIPVILLPDGSDHELILEYHSQARISIGLSIGDAISTSLLEAMSVGSFPIQSNTSCADEWIIEGITGITVPPEDPEIIEFAIRKAIINDRLVDEASVTNIEKIKNLANFDKLKQETITTYNKIYNS
jgi:glycosyltransferase involved in cell wall biosynthesis